MFALQKFWNDKKLVMWNISTILNMEILNATNHNSYLTQFIAFTAYNEMC